LINISILVILWLFVLFLLLKLIFYLLRKRLLQRVRNRFTGGEIRLCALNANSLGRKLKAGRQIRGNGALVLTDSELWFTLAVPEREILIPINKIRAVELRKSHLGKIIFRPLLYIEYMSAEGEDGIAWYVKNPETWQKAIADIVAGL
jgi:hypothetical protein